MKLLVCGGRDYGDSATAYAVLDGIVLKHGRPELVIHGAARGADRIAGAWALERGIECREYPADWNLGKHAGPLRNATMLREGKPDLVVAFPGGRGTADMVAKARAAGVEVIRVLTDEDW